MGEQIDINSICGDILNNGQHLGNHQARLRTLMEHFSRAGTPISVIASKRYMDRSIVTIKQYCREYDIKLSDWTPRHLREKKPQKTAVK